MKIRINHGRRFGEIQHIERNQTTSLLLTLGLIEEIEEQARPHQQHGQAAPINVETPTFDVVRLGAEQNPAIRFRTGTQISYYQGSPDNAGNFRPSGGESGPNADVCALYASECARFSALMRPLRSVNDRQAMEDAMARQKDLPGYKLPPARKQ